MATAIKAMSLGDKMRHSWHAGQPAATLNTRPIREGNQSVSPQQQHLLFLRQTQL